MKIFRFRKPYKKNGRTNFPESQKRKGVYLIRVNGVIRYIGHSASDLYKTMYRHFQSWEDKNQVRVTYQHWLNQARYDIKVRLVFTNTAKQAKALEKALILKYRPKDNPDKLDLFDPTPGEEKYMNKVEDEYFDTYTEAAPF